MSGVFSRYTDAASPDADTVAVEIRRICDSRAFRHSLRQQQLLRYLIGRKLADDRVALREIAIGIDFFRRDPKTYDPKIDAVVRVEVARLRQRLHRYYAEEGAAAAVEVCLIAGSYVPLLRKRAAKAIEIANRAVIAVPALPEPPADRTSLDAEALTREIVETLACLPWVRVMESSTAPESTASKRPQAKPPTPQVDWVLQGRWIAGQASSLIVELVPGRDASPLMSRSIDLAADSALKAHQRLRNELLQYFVPLLAPHGGHPGAAALRGKSAASTRSTAAFDLYHRARAILRQPGSDATAKAVPLLERAVRLDPEFAAAWSELATAYAQRRQLVRTHLERDTTPAVEAAQRAISLDPGAGLAHATLGSLAYSTKFDWPQAQQHFANALAAKPEEAAVRAAYATFLLYSARFEDAQREYDVLRALNPLDLTIRRSLGCLYFYWQRYDLAEDLLKQALEITPQDIYATLLLADTFAQSGRFAESLQAAELMLTLSPGYANSWVYKARALHLLGEHLVADELMSFARARFDARLISGYEEAMLALARGDRNLALEHIRELAIVRGNGSHCIVVDPTFASLWSDPRWSKVLADAGLPDFRARYRAALEPPFPQ